MAEDMAGWCRMLLEKTVHWNLFPQPGPRSTWSRKPQTLKPCGSSNKCVDPKYALEKLRNAHPHHLAILERVGDCRFGMIRTIFSSAYSYIDVKKVCCFKKVYEIGRLTPVGTTWNMKSWRKFPLEFLAPPLSPPAQLGPHQALQTAPRAKTDDLFVLSGMCWHSREANFKGSKATPPDLRGQHSEGCTCFCRDSGSSGFTPSKNTGLPA